ncbi:MAG: SpoIIE family protein phosphatase [Nitrospinae bacterium]|nr:SpoIIE family protein phosphatase [Nitrospinota bacterium]
MKKIAGPEKKLAQCKEQVQQLRTCYQIASLLNSQLNLPNLLDSIMTIAKQVMNADASSLLLMDREKGDLYFQVALSAVGDQVKSLPRMKLGEGIAGTVAETGKALIVKDALKHPRFNPEFDKKTGFQTGSILCAPLLYKGEVLGVCQVIHRREKGKTFSGKDLSMFQLFCNSAALAIQNARMHEVLMRKQRLEKDMAFAKSVQESFLPAHVPQHEGFSFAAKTVPAQLVGGDFYDFIPFADDLLGVVVGDVSGKGVSAALHMARLMSDFRYVSQSHREPGDALGRVNNILCERGRHGMFTTAVYLLLDMKRKTVTAANAGHPSLLLRTAEHRVEMKAGASGAPLGIVPDLGYAQEEIPLHRGDRVLLYTDGVIEPINAKGRPFGLSQLIKLFEKDESPPEVFISHLEQTIHRFAMDDGRFDDMTCVEFQAL